MVKIYGRYLGAQFIKPFMVSSAFFVLFMMIFQMFRIVSLVVNKGVSVFILLELLFYISLTFIPFAVPIAILFSTLYTLNRLSEDSEVIVLRSIGLTKNQIFLPFLYVGIAIGALSFVFSAELVPMGKRESRKIVNFLTSRGFLADIQKKSFYQQIPGATIYAENVKEKGRFLDDVFINMVSKDSSRKIVTEQTIMAKKGELIKEENIQTQRS